MIKLEYHLIFLLKYFLLINDDRITIFKLCKSVIQFLLLLIILMVNL